MKKYNIIFLYSKEDACYITYVPKLPGCMADGKTIEEAVANTNVVISEWIDEAKRLGRDIPVNDASTYNSTNPSVFDVAKYILKKCGNMTTMALEKMVYYCKAWSLAWYKKPLFPEKFQAWARGPVCRPLFDAHKGCFIITESSIESNHRFSASEKIVMDSIIDVYRQFDADSLSEFTHFELPWKIARGNLKDEEKSRTIISDKSMIQYYGKVSD